MNNPDSSTMFAHIVSRLTNRTEDVAVEALGFILSRSDAARRALRDLLKVEGLDVGELTDAGTQVGDETLARPDLAIYDRERKERVLIEAKFWAGLTENQPIAYLVRLPLDERPAVLLFVAPEARIETLWPELRRVIEHPFGWQPVDVSNDTEIKCALVDEGTRFLVLVSWRALLDRMLSFAMSSGDSIKADIRQLHTLCEQQDQEAFLPLKPHELAPEIPRRMLQFNRLVDDAVELARERDIVNTDRLKRKRRALHGYGRYLRLGSKEADVWGGGVVSGSITRSGPGAGKRPFGSASTIGDGVITVDELRDRLGNDIWANTPDSIPFHLPTGVEYDKVLVDVVERLVSITTQIAAEEAP